MGQETTTITGPLFTELSVLVVEICAKGSIRGEVELSAHFFFLRGGGGESMFVYSEISSTSTNYVSCALHPMK